MRIMSIDMGENTGIVCFSYEIDLVSPILLYFSGTVESYKCFDLIATYRPEIILLEKFPEKNSLSDDIYRDYLNVNYLDQTFLVAPVLWKPIARKKKWKLLFKGTKHEQDAFNMARYYIFSQHRKDVLKGKAIQWTA